MTLFNFPNIRSLDATRYYRAFADVVITNPAGTLKSPTFQCLVDTGSDYTILPSSAALAVGIAVGVKTAAFKTASGTSYSLPYSSGVPMIVEGYAFTDSIVFSPATGFMPIIGRRQLLAAFDVGLDNSNWYWG